jgi:hypothetical protein
MSEDETPVWTSSALWLSTEEQQRGALDTSFAFQPIEPILRPSARAQLRLAQPHQRFG